MTLLNTKKHKIKFIVSITLLFSLIIICSTQGAANINFSEALYIICAKIPLLGNLFQSKTFPLTHNLIILKIRLPRILLACLVGAGLSIIGTSFQAIFKNPMADPYVLGVSSGAALGASIGIILASYTSFYGLGIITLMAFIGALLITFIVYNIARVGNKLPTTTLLLAGISMSFLLSSIISLIMVFNKQALEKIIFWTMGSFSTANWNQVIMLLPFVFIGIITLIVFSRELNIILTGDDTARSLGIEVEKIKKIILIISSIVVAACVSVSGIIGFVGLIIPHMMRLILGPNHKILIPFSAIGGAIFLMLSDTLSRTMFPPTEVPVGAITSLIGAPYFIYLLIKNKKNH